MIFITSWDDGDPLDIRLAELLDRFGLKGTFFVPVRNQEGRDVLSSGDLRRINSQFEIGSHTLDHTYLTKVQQLEAMRQIVEGKNMLEQLLGSAVKGFCYPGGKLNSMIHQTVIEAGFAYARTIENFRFDCDGDRFSVPATIQFFPHSTQVLFRNFMRYGHYATRLKALKAVLREQNWIDSMYRLLDIADEGNRILHVWGHSWEIEEHALWPQLENFLSHVSARNPVSYTLGELMQKREWFA